MTALMPESPEEMTARIVAATAISTEIAVIKNDVAMLKHQQISFESEVSRKIDKIFDKLELMATGRPTWAISLILGSLFSICVGLTVYTITHN